MRVVYYTHPSFLDTALPLFRELTRLVELHVILEVSPESWSSSVFHLSRLPLRSGIVPALPVLDDHFPAGVRACWRDAASFNFAVHNCRQSIHPNAWWISRRVVRFIRELNPSVVHLDEGSLRLAWALYGMGNAKLVLGVHDAEPHSGEQNWRTELSRALTLRRARHCILHNHALVEAFHRRYRVSASRVEVIPLGALDIFREWLAADAPSSSSDDRTVLFFGRLSPYKGLETLYRAVPDVMRRLRDVRFVVAGRPVHGYIPPPIPPVSNGGHVEVVEGYISNERLAGLFNRATVVVCPYTDATQSGVILTAYAFGKPVIATRVGGLPEYVRQGETGVLVPAREPAALSAALVDVLIDPDLRTRLRNGISRLLAGPLAWSTIARNTVGVYERCIGVRSTHAANSMIRPEVTSE